MATYSCSCLSADYLFLAVAVWLRCVGYFCVILRAALDMRFIACGLCMSSKFSADRCSQYKELHITLSQSTVFDSCATRCTVSHVLQFLPWSSKVCKRQISTSVSIDSSFMWSVNIHSFHARSGRWRAHSLIHMLCTTGLLSGSDCQLPERRRSLEMISDACRMPALS